MIKKFRMDWENWQHSFIFEGCDRLSDEDMLKDLIQSLEHLRKHICENFDLTEDTAVFYVTGGYDFTHIEETP